MRRVITKLERFQQAESLEPMFTWGVRMGLSLVVPMLIGFATGHLSEAVWVGLIAEGIAWVELKGSIFQRVQIVLAGILITLLSTAIGALTGFSIILSTLAMLGVGLISGLFKNLGDRASGLAICVYVTFILSNANPPADADDFLKRLTLTGIGGVWCLFLALAFSVTLRQNEPYRRSIALIWRSIGALLEAIAQGWNGKSPRSSIQNTFRKEIEVRKALDASIALYGTLAHQVGREQGPEANLAIIRKSTALVAIQVVAMGEAAESLRLHNIPSEVRNATYGIYRTLTQAAFRMSSYMVSLLPEESLLLRNRITRVHDLSAVLETYIVQKGIPDTERRAFTKIMHLALRTAKLVERTLERLEGATGEKRVYRSYSLLKTIYVLHPGNLLRSLQLLFNTHTEHFRYALRMAIASALAMGFSKILPGHHNYWIPFTVILIIQPYIGATLTKARDRVLGTVAGGIVGGLFLLLPNNLFVQEGLLFAASVLMVMYIRKNYAIAAFFITVSLVMLLDVERQADLEIILIRAISTLVGAAIAVLSSFVLLPEWDKKKLPEHLADALRRNQEYLLFTYGFSGKNETWTRLKRLAETANSRAFESLQRYLEEPGGRQKQIVQPYQLLTHNVRITRDLNQIHLERENPATTLSTTPTVNGTPLLESVLKLFRSVQKKQISPDAPVASLPENIPALQMTMAETELLQKIYTELQGMENTLLR